MKALKITNLSDTELQKIAEKFPEITDLTLPELDEQLSAINEDYPFEFPLWAIIAITVLVTIVAIILKAVTIVCRHSGKCLVEQYFTKSLAKGNSLNTTSV